MLRLDRLGGGGGGRGVIDRVVYFELVYSHLYKKSMYTLCTFSEQPLHAEASTILDLSLSHTYERVFSDINMINMF